MKNFDDYTFADIDKECTDKITQLEHELKSECGEDVVLIAYHPKDEAKIQA